MVIYLELISVIYIEVYVLLKNGVDTKKSSPRHIRCRKSAQGGGPKTTQIPKKIIIYHPIKTFDRMIFWPKSDKTIFR